jgi:hypothetical protein
VVRAGLRYVRGLSDTLLDRTRNGRAVRLLDDFICRAATVDALVRSPLRCVEGADHRAGAPGVHARRAAGCRAGQVEAPAPGMTA